MSNFSHSTYIFVNSLIIKYKAEMLRLYTDVTVSCHIDWYKIQIKSQILDSVRRAVSYNNKKLELQRY